MGGRRQSQPRVRDVISKECDPCLSCLIETWPWTWCALRGCSARGGRWMGRGNKIAADQAAVDAMRLVLNTIEMDGVIVIGEGEKDEAPMLYNGERLGTAMRRRSTLPSIRSTGPRSRPGAAPAP